MDSGSNDDQTPITRVRALRELRGVSPSVMADATGLSLSSWQRFERGAPATLDVWINTAWMLSVDFDDLVGETRLKKWIPTVAFPEPPPDPVLDYWANEPPHYHEVVEYLNRIAPDA